MISRRKFLERSAWSATGLTLFSTVKTLRAKEGLQGIPASTNLQPEEIAEDESYWEQVRKQFTLHPGIINLNNAGVSPQPLIVQSAYIDNYLFCNQIPSYHLWQVLEPKREQVRGKLADLAGCLAEEIAITRNTTEGLNAIIFGIDLRKGDEVVLSKYDYPNMVNAWKQREKRDGITLNWVDLSLPEENEEMIVEQYRKAISDRTKIIHITHLINYTGQILPVQKIADMARQLGCEVIVDGAHSFAHIDFKISELNCDYFATSLHKWLCAPFGTGFMYIRKNKISKVWALLSAPVPDAANIGKFECTGTRSFASEAAIAQAIDFHCAIGNKAKEARLRYLKNYWCNRVKNVKGVQLFTSLDKNFSCGIACFYMSGWSAAEMYQQLFEKYKIHTAVIEHEQVKGVRVSPHIYTSAGELDTLIKAISEMSAQTESNNK